MLYSDAIPGWRGLLLRGDREAAAGLARACAAARDLALAARTEVPFIGALLTLPAMPLVMSWAGFPERHARRSFPPLATRPGRTPSPRSFVFHFCTHLLFVIGVFPFLMVSGATLFFDADWPRKVLGASSRSSFARAPIRQPRPAVEWTPFPWDAGRPARPCLVAGYCLAPGGDAPLRANLYSEATCSGTSRECVIRGASWCAKRTAAFGIEFGGRMRSVRSRSLRAAT